MTITQALPTVKAQCPLAISDGGTTQRAANSQASG